MKRKIIESTLIIILRASGILLVTAFIAVFLPYEMMDKIHQQMGLGHLPQVPILDYLARSVSLFYGIHGVIVLYVSFNLMKYLQFLKLLCYLGLVFGVAMIMIDFNAAMPASWSFAEGPLIISLNLVIYFLVKMLESRLKK